MFLLLIDACVNRYKQKVGVSGLQTSLNCFKLLAMPPLSCVYVYGF